MVGLARRLLGEYAAADASAHGAEPHVEEEESHTVVYAIVIACLGVLFGTFLRWLETQIVPSLQDFKYLRLIGMPPYTLSVFFAGILTSGAHDALNNAHATYTGYKLVGGVEGGPPDHEKPFLITLAINAAQTVDAHVILLVLLPPLIYESAANMSWHVFSRISGQAFLLAFPGVVIQTCAQSGFRARARTCSRAPPAARARAGSRPRRCLRRPLRCSAAAGAAQCPPLLAFSPPSPLPGCARHPVRVPAPRLAHAPRACSPRAALGSAAIWSALSSATR